MKFELNLLYLADNKDTVFVEDSNYARKHQITQKLSSKISMFVTEL